MRRSTKVWWQSKTMLVNILTIVVVILVQVINSPELKDYSKIAVVVLAFANIILRILTTDPIRK